MTAPRPGKPDICSHCGAKLYLYDRRYYHPKSDCILGDDKLRFSFADTPENVAKWNRRTGKPLWAPERKPERPWEDPDYLATHPRKE